LLQELFGLSDIFGINGKAKINHLSFFLLSVVTHFVSKNSLRSAPKQMEEISSP